MAKILVVDDSASMRPMVEFTLKEAGHQVTVAEDGQAALNLSLIHIFAKEVSTVEEPIEMADDVKLNNGLLLLHQYQTDYLAKQDEQYLEKFKKTLSRFSNLLAVAEITDGTKAEVERELAIYRDRFLAWVDAIKASNAQVDILSQAAHELEPNFERLLEEGRKMAAADLEYQQRQRRWTTWLMATTIGVIGAVLVAFLILLTRRIVRSLRQGVQLAERLAKGDLTARMDVACLLYTSRCV